MSLMNKVKIIALFCALATGTLEARAQGAKIQLQHLEKLSAKAAETVDVSLDSQTLQVAAKFLRADRPDEAAIKIPSRVARASRFVRFCVVLDTRAARPRAKI